MMVSVLIEGTIRLADRGGILQSGSIIDTASQLPARCDTIRVLQLRNVRTDFAEKRKIVHSPDHMFLIRQERLANKRRIVLTSG